MKLPKGLRESNIIDQIAEDKAIKQAEDMERQLAKEVITKTIGGVTITADGGGRPLGVDFEDGATAEDCFHAWFEVWQIASKRRNDAAVAIIKKAKASHTH